MRKKKISVLAFPNGKINLGLQVLQKRSDGFHTIQTVFYPIPVKDVLEIVPAQDSLQQPAIHNYGLPVKGEAADNLCIKAWQLLKNDFPDLPPVTIHLLKHIPMGAGLGGGSSDGVCTLQLLNSKFQLHLSGQQLARYALQLGSDCPFFLLNQPCFATGRGEILEPLSVDLSSWYLVLANPAIHVSTAWAFAQLNVNDSLTKKDSLQQAVVQPITEWKQHLINDFEQPVFEKYPEIGAMKEKLYQQGAIYASMSGSGSTVFGLFKERMNWAAALPAKYTIVQL